MGSCRRLGRGVVPALRVHNGKGMRSCHCPWWAKEKLFSFAPTPISSNNLNKDMMPKHLPSMKYVWVIDSLCVAITWPRGLKV